MNEKILTARAVADILQVNRETIYRLVHANELPHFRVGSAIRFRETDIENWMAGKSVIAKASERK